VPGTETSGICVYGQLSAVRAGRLGESLRPRTSALAAYHTRHRNRAERSGAALRCGGFISRNPLQNRHTAPPPAQEPGQRIATRVRTDTATVMFGSGNWRPREVCPHYLTLSPDVLATTPLTVGRIFVEHTGSKAPRGAAEWSRAPVLHCPQCRVHSLVCISRKPAIF
jgi:hypothetical protein